MGRHPHSRHHDSSKRFVLDYARCHGRERKKEEFSLVDNSLLSATTSRERVTASVTDRLFQRPDLRSTSNGNMTASTRNTSAGDFGYGWNLGINTDLTVDSSYNVTFTLGGHRRTFYFIPQNPYASLSSLQLLGIGLGNLGPELMANALGRIAAYTPEPGLPRHAHRKRYGLLQCKSYNS